MSKSLQHALERQLRCNLRDARLRLTMRMLVSAGEADPKLHEKEPFRRAQIALANLLQEKAELSAATAPFVARSEKPSPSPAESL